MNPANATRACTIAAAALAVILITTTRAGDLEPPPGPVTPTTKTLNEIEPRIPINQTNTPGDADSLFKITQPGSYYLTGDIIGVPDKHGIGIATHDVTLDLTGYTVRGVPGSDNGISRVDGLGLQNIHITNGLVGEWGNRGIDLALDENHHISDIRAFANGDHGIYCGDAAVIDSCIALANGGHGISSGHFATIRSCVATDNTRAGISTDSTASISDSSAYRNGMEGITTDDAGVIIGCTSRGNTLVGIEARSGSVIANCASYYNDSDGIRVTTGATVTFCSAYKNDGDGIELLAACHAIHNTCFLNRPFDGDSAGIRATGNDNRIESNAVINNNSGITVEDAGNVIIRNTSSGNGINYDIAADNRYGPIVDIASPGTPAAYGTTAAGTMDTSDPWANFSH